ncbi:MAG: DUF481 domain-containing protein [Ignavibacteriales bacterium]|nr:MAG: DUF481 domain-containing protein [Ignavibacteriales bacterium]
MKTLLYIFLVLFVSISLAQVNTEKFRKDFDQHGFFGSISLAAGFASGNSEFVKAKGGLRIDYAGSNYDFFLVGNYEFEEANEAKVVNKGFAHLRNILPLSSIFSLEFFLQKEFNQFILLEDRNLAGAGLRIDLISLFSDSSDAIELFAGTGLMFENEKYNIPVSPETNLIRSTNYLTFKWQVNNNFSFIAINYLQFDVERFHDYRFITDTGLNFLIFENLTFTSSVSFRYDNEPVPDVKDFDIELTNGITFSF